MSNVILVGQQAGADRITGEEIVAVLHEAVGVISSVCDYAQQLDARGFSAADAWLGHVLAQMSPRLWSDDVALTAWDMLRKYRGQLAAAGIDYDRLPRPAGAAEVGAEQREQTRGRARDHARQWREQDYRHKHSYVRCDGEGENVILAFPFNPELVAGCRKIDGRCYDGATKTNVFPFASLPAVISLAEAHGIEVTADVRALAAITTARAEEMAARPEIRLPDHAVFPQVTPGGEPVHDSVVIDTDYNPGLNEALKELNGGKSTWNHASGVHRLPLRCVTGLPEVAERYSLRIGADVSALITKVASELDRTRAAAGAFDAEPVPVPGLAAGMTLKPQQYPVVRFAVDHRRVLVGDDMGWGKTASSLAAVAADGAYPAVVVCRPSLTLNWAAEIRRFFPALAVHEASGTSPQPIPDGTGIVVIGSAALAATPRKKGRGGKQFGWVETLKKITPKALIIDEGQDTKERGANRSQACEQLAAAVIARNGLVLNLTGTAILNRPRELCQQLTILDRIDEFGGPKTFLWRYCLSETNEWGASYNGARNLAELHDRLRSWGIMIRRSDDAALGLPPCREHVLHIPIEHLDGAVMARYQEAEADLLGFLAEKARQTAERLGKDPASAAVEAAMRASAAEHLVAINTLRQLAGQAKRGYVTAWVREHVQAGEKVMVAAHHRGEVDAYAAAFGGLKLQGGQPVAEKEAVKARFRQRPAADAPVIAVAIGAGGVGHTLTAARIGIQAEHAWTPGETQQMKKRLHRIGQDRPVDYYITVAEHTIDEQLWAVVTAKQATLDAVLDGRSDTSTATDDKSVAAELTWRLTQQGLGTRPELATKLVEPDGATGMQPPAPIPLAPPRKPGAADDDTTSDDHGASAAHAGGTGVGGGACAVSGSRGGPGTPMAAAKPGGCTVPGCGQPGRLYPAGTLCDTHRPATPVPAPRTCPGCGRGVPAHAPGCAERLTVLWPASDRLYGARDEITVRHWQEAHIDPDRVRAWCRDTGRDEPPAGGALPGDLAAAYLADRGAADIPMPGGPAHADWLAHRPALAESFTARLGRLTVVYGPCPRCGHPTAAEPGEPLPLCLDCASGSGGGDGPPLGSGQPPGHGAPGGFGTGRPGQTGQRAEDGDDEVSAQAQITGQQLRESAHRYLEDGLLPVPAWCVRRNGQCCCPRGANCPRPGKHPRSVYTGPGPHDYSWKPLACGTHVEIDERFGVGSQYAAGNLMVAIPEGMMAIDVDDDDGGRAAAARLAGELGQLPPTLSHPTPHGEHRIYRTPPGWKGRAWVGKDPSNPVPPGIDLRMPGQILMAAPSVVPGPEGPIRYGPLTGDYVAQLPAAYVTAWTPPRQQPRPAGRRVPVPPDSADRAAMYVHQGVTRIAEDLASRQPGGRNAAAYAAGLKAGSLLGAARTTPGAEQAAAEWTDEAAEEALMDAAERNGYTGKDGQAEARRAIRSGLRNGMRNPRTLPDFTSSRPALDQRHRPAALNPASSQPTPARTTPGRQAGGWQDLVPDGIRRQVQAADQAAASRRRAAIAVHQQALERHDRSASPETAAEVERTRAAAQAAHQAYTQDGRHVTGRHDAAMLRWAANITARREPQAAGPSAGQQDSPCIQANRGAIAANQAYKAGDLDCARQLTDEAAAFDPSRAGLWQQQRDQIAARRLILDARAAHTEGDHPRAQELLAEARQLDVRMPAIWNGDLPAVPRPGNHARGHASVHGSGTTTGTSQTGAQQPARERRAPSAEQGTPSEPSWPSPPARADPPHPAPESVQHARAAQLSARGHVTAVPREPRVQPGIAADGTEGTEAPAGPGDGDPAARGPAPSPRAPRQPEPGTPGQQARHEATAHRATAGSRQAGAAADAGARNTASHDPASADWRDQILADARAAWQPGPVQPCDPAVFRPPEPQTHEPQMQEHDLEPP